MNLIANILVGIVVLLYLYFLILEMFLWDKPQGRKTFGTTPEFATASKTLAANQGLYNSFLAAGVFGALTVSRKILYVQALPALLALVLVLL